MTPDERATVAWAGVVAGATIVECRALRLGHKHATLSAAVRAFYKTDTPVGRLAFVASWALLTVWFLPHVIDGGPNS